MNKIQVNCMIIFSIAMLILGCQKEGLNDPNTPLIPQIDSTRDTNLRLSYGDTLFFLRNQIQDYIITPTNIPSQQGFFKAIPTGLNIDSISGRINVSQSEMGLRYKIYYMGIGGDALDSVKLVLSGIDYKDGIYEIAQTQNTYDTAFPIYNARPELVLPCGDDDEDNDGDLDDDDNQCVFDETDLNDDGNDDISGVIQEKLLVDIKKGTIDLEASFHAGIFGSSNPANGISRDFTFYYRLQDASNRALNNITVRIYHYKTRRDIPQTLLDTLELRNQIAFGVNQRNAVKKNSINGSPAGLSRPDNNPWGRVPYLSLYQYKPKRPPIIIIVSQ